MTSPVHSRPPNAAELLHLQSSPMGNYTLETGEYIYHLTCECCLTEKNRVWGFVSKDGDAHAVYYALLNLEEKCPRVGLTLSVGPWLEGTEPSQRVWVHLNIFAEDTGIEIGIRDPKESNFFPWEKGGAPLNREEAKAHSGIEERPISLSPQTWLFPHI